MCKTSHIIIFLSLKMHIFQGLAAFNTLTSMQYFYITFGPTPVGRLPGTINKGSFKAIRYSLES